eukprot:TRINITY_DN1605_c0_g1_i1.p1 TRINITY_DN1605_c0_g1~~TRINITY_DN1605_c0_g1_i1.p1  ORF type:complete len:168 (+),score=26.95 TRINITY_DN1605_c0_g1_i1:392-895(+)
MARGSSRNASEPWLTVRACTACRKIDADGEDVDVVRCMRDTDERSPGAGVLGAVAFVSMWLMMLPESLLKEGALTAVQNAQKLETDQRAERIQGLFEAICKPGTALFGLLETITKVKAQHGQEIGESLVLMWAPTLLREEARVNMVLMLPSLTSAINELAACINPHP